MSARSSLTARIAVPALLVLTATVVHGRFPLEGLGQPRPASEAPTDRSGWTSSDTSGQPGTAVVTRAGGGEWSARNICPRDPERPRYPSAGKPTVPRLARKACE